MFRLLVFCLFSFLSFIVATPSHAASQYIGTCPEEKEIKADPNGWYQKQPELQQSIPDPYPFYDPYVDGKYPKNTHLDTTMLPNPDNLACLIEYAKKEWHDMCGTKFEEKYITQAIDSFIGSGWNPSVWLAIWIEESHAGDIASDPAYCSTGIREFGCGPPGSNNYGFYNQLQCIDHGIDDKYKQNTFACWLCSYGGDCPDSLGCGYGDPDGIISTPYFKNMVLFYDYLTRGVISTLGKNPLNFNFTQHPLRPNPGKASGVDDDFLTTYCAMRPTPVQMNQIDIRKPTTNLETVGLLTQDFTKFVTPLLSITDSKKADYAIPFNDKAQRYLADYLEGRAYYEPQAESTATDTATLSDIFNRMGVFRKLAPQSYQDELKRALIQRANGQFSSTDNPYGFPPASETVQNYTVGFWQNKEVTLKDFVGNWAPLPDDSGVNDYSAAYSLWKARDGGKWAALWPYVPMFSREDTEGTVEIIDSNPPPEPWSPPGSTPIEINHSSTKELKISHPHLARTYEVSSSLSLLLAPQATVAAETPQLKDEWLPKMWELSNYWLDPSYIKPYPPKVPVTEALLGPLCDLDPNYATSIYSSGDPALNDKFSTNVRRQDLNVPLDWLGIEQSPPIPGGDQCGTGTEYRNYECEVCVGDKKDVSGCFVYKQVRSNPDYLISHTPFLKEILTNTTLSSRGIFDIFTAYDPQKEKSLDQKYGWPGLGNEGEESPVYDFQGNAQSHAEAGVYKPGNTQSYYYRYLGTVQCAKERVMQVLQPFITGESYKPYAYDCFPEMSPPASPPPTGNGLVWPCKNAYILYTSSSGEDLAVCYEDPDRPFHKGLDLQCPDGQIYPSAPGTVVAVNNDPDAHGFGIYVIIDHHNGWFTLYAHLAETMVSVGQSVDLNTQIGVQDNTGAWSDGSHLHLGYSQGSNPDQFLSGGPTSDPCKAISGCVCN